MNVLDDYMVDPRLSLLDKTRIQAQVLVRYAGRCALDFGARLAIARQALRESSKALFAAVGNSIDRSPRRKSATMQTTLTELAEAEVTVECVRHDKKRSNSTSRTGSQVLSPFRRTSRL